MTNKNTCFKAVIGLVIVVVLVMVPTCMFLRNSDLPF